MAEPISGEDQSVDRLRGVSSDSTNQDDTSDSSPTSSPRISSLEEQDSAALLSETSSDDENGLDKLDFTDQFGGHFLEKITDLWTRCACRPNFLSLGVPFFHTPRPFASRFQRVPIAKNRNRQDQTKAKDRQDCCWFTRIEAAHPNKCEEANGENQQSPEGRGMDFSSMTLSVCFS